jgi:hypothetical protein
MIPKMILKYQPKGKRNLKRWKDCSVTPVTGPNRPNTGKNDDDDDDDVLINMQACS